MACPRSRENRMLQGSDRDQSWIHRRQIAVVQGGDRYTVSGVRASYPSPVARSLGRNPWPVAPGRV